MKDIDHRIAQSDAEWHRYRYEQTGVRESAHLLCGALGKSLKKRLNSVARNVLAGRKKAVFQPAYDGKKENIVVSLTSTPKKIRTIFPTLYSLMAQDHKPDRIVLWIGDPALYPAEILSRIRRMGIQVECREDLGPHTKYHYAFREYKDDLVITVDDDIIYHENMIGELYAAHLEYPELVIARRVHRIRFGRDRKPLKYLDWIWEYRDADRPSHDLFATGVGGVLYPPAVMALECWDNMDFLKISPGADDIWLKFCELSAGIKVYAVKNSGISKDAFTFATQKTGLALVNKDRGRNDEYIRACTVYFGMDGDLCERVLAEE